MPSKHSTEILPIFSLLVAATLWGLSWYPLRLLQDSGLSGVWTTLIIYGVALLVGLVIYHRRLHQLGHQPALLILVALANGWTNVGFILAVIEGNVVRVMLLFYLSPLWSTLLGWLVLREHLSKLSLAILALAMSGALIMLWDPVIGAPWPQQRADWLAISAGVAFSMANVTVRKLQNVSIGTKNLATWIGVTMVALIWIAIDQTPLPLVSREALTWTVTLGAALIITATFTVQYGVTHMPVYRSAVILLFELVAGAVSSQILSDEIVSYTEWFGGGLIVFAAYLSSRMMFKVADQAGSVNA